MVATIATLTVVLVGPQRTAPLETVTYSKIDPDVHFRAYETTTAFKPVLFDQALVQAYLSWMEQLPDRQLLSLLARNARFKTATINDDTSRRKHRDIYFLALIESSRRSLKTGLIPAGTITE